MYGVAGGRVVAVHGEQLGGEDDEGWAVGGHGCQQSGLPDDRGDARSRRKEKVPRKGWWTCPGCQNTRCKFDTHKHHLVGHLTPRGLVCAWHRYLPDQPPPADWPHPSPTSRSPV
ncbi:hypothetical protein GCM10009609_17270 [Pseudonocardia aurantiaca]